MYIYNNVYKCIARNVRRKKTNLERKYGSARHSKILARPVHVSFASLNARIVAIITATRALKQQRRKGDARVRSVILSFSLLPSRFVLLLLLLFFVVFFNFFFYYFFLMLFSHVTLTTKRWYIESRAHLNPRLFDQFAVGRDVPTENMCTPSSRRRLPHDDTTHFCLVRAGTFFLISLRLYSSLCTSKNQQVFYFSRLIFLRGQTN